MTVTAGADGQVRLEVLGHFRAWRGKSEIPLGSPQQRAVLAMLVLHDGATVSIAVLVDGLWGENSPNRAVAALRTYVGRLRAAFGRDGAEPVIVSVGGGYQLAAGVPTDLGDFERGLAEAERARTSGEPAAARTALLAALGLWRGEPLDEVPGPYAQSQRTRLTEQRLAALEARLELDLALGRHAEAATELSELVHRYPLRERWHGLLMRALHDSGRVAEALGVYSDLRRILDRELGCGPGEELRELHAKLQAATDPGRLPGVPKVVVPAQLPATTADFTGRGEEAESLREALIGGTPAPVSAVTGTGGVGKTALAVNVAHGLRNRFPDGQLYVDLRGTGTQQPAAPDVVLAGFLHALGVPRMQLPAGSVGRSDLFKSLVADRKMLVLLDNARDAGQVEPLLPGGGGCGVLVTSRTKLGGLPGRTLHLDVLSADEALALLARLVGEERVDAEREAALEVVAACSFLPLAIRVAGARLASRPSWTIASLAERLAGERRRLRELRAADLAVEATFDLGYAQLPSAQRRAFRLLSSIDGVEFTVAPATAILDRAEDETQTLLDALVDASLLEKPAPQVYRFHDLVKVYSRHRSEAEDSAAERAAALERLLDYALATACNVYRCVEPESTLPDHVSPTTSAGSSFTGPQDAQDWLAHRRPVLLASCRRVAENPACRLRPAADLLLIIGTLGDAGNAPQDVEETARLQIRVSQERDDPGSTARALVVSGMTALFNGRLDEAEKARLLAVRISREIGDHLLVATCMLASGVMAVETGRYADADGELGEALAEYTAIDDRPGKLYTLAYLARTQLGLGDAAMGLAMARDAVRLSQTVGPSGLAARAALHQLGNVLAMLGKLAEAISVAEESLELERKSKNSLREASVLLQLADLHLRADRPAESMKYAELAHGTSRRTGHAQYRSLALKSLGAALDALGRPDQARACRQEAVDVLAA